MTETADRTRDASPAGISLPNQRNLSMSTSTSPPSAPAAVRTIVRRDRVARVLLMLVGLGAGRSHGGRDQHGLGRRCCHARRRDLALARPRPFHRPLRSACVPPRHYAGVWEL